MGDFCMPSLGADMEAGKLVEWLIKPGAQVRRGDIVAVVETQKGLFEIEAFEDGILGEPLVQAGEEVPVGTVLAVISADDGGAAELGAEPLLVESATTEQRTVPPPPSHDLPVAATALISQPERIAASPSARRLAAELGVDLAVVHGTGPHGSIQRSDIELAARKTADEMPPPATAPAEPPPATGGTGMRRAIAAAMSRSNREIPHYYLETEIDMTAPLQWLEAENVKKPIRERILPVAVLLKAVALALRDVPELNGYWLDDHLQIKKGIHIGFALALRQGGLLTPAMHDVDAMPLHQVMQTMADLIERGRSGRLRSSEMTDATISVTNLGDRGVKTAFGVIYPPQVALIAFGRIMERPWVEQGLVVTRRCLTATLAGDHRATDGHTGALYLEALNRHLQQPEAL